MLPWLLSSDLLPDLLKLSQLGLVGSEELALGIAVTNLTSENDFSGLLATLESEPRKLRFLRFVFQIERLPQCSFLFFQEFQFGEPFLLTTSST